jgi:hypothetical protein
VTMRVFRKNACVSVAYSCFVFVVIGLGAGEGEGVMQNRYA